MTLEERMDKLELMLANQQSILTTLINEPTAMKDAANAAIRSALRPGGQLYGLRADTSFSAGGGQVFIDDAKINAGEVKAAQVQTAEFKVTSPGSYEADRDRLLDIATTLTRDSLQLSRLLERP